MYGVYRIPWHTSCFVIWFDGDDDDDGDENHIDDGAWHTNCSQAESPSNILSKDYFFTSPIMITFLLQIYTRALIERGPQLLDFFTAVFNENVVFPTKDEWKELKNGVQ